MLPSVCSTNRCSRMTDADRLLFSPSLAGTLSITLSLHYHWRKKYQNALCAHRCRSELQESRPTSLQSPPRWRENERLSAMGYVTGWCWCANRTILSQLHNLHINSGTLAIDFLADGNLDDWKALERDREGQLSWQLSGMIWKVKFNLRKLLNPH